MTDLRKIFIEKRPSLPPRKIFLLYRRRESNYDRLTKNIYEKRQSLLYHEIFCFCAGEGRRKMITFYTPDFLSPPPNSKSWKTPCCMSGLMDHDADISSLSSIYHYHYKSACFRLTD